MEGLDAGADDYLAKPFRTEELLARVRVVLERAAGRRTAGALATTAHPPTAPVPIATAVPVPEPAARARRPRAGTGRPVHRIQSWRLPSEAAAIPALRRRLRSWLTVCGVEPDEAYDLLLAACEAATNAVEHAQDPTEPFFDVTAAVVDRGDPDRGARLRPVARADGVDGPRSRRTLMSAVGDITATPSPEGRRS